MSCVEIGLVVCCGGEIGLVVCCGSDIGLVGYCGGEIGLEGFSSGDIGLVGVIFLLGSCFITFIIDSSTFVLDLVLGFI